MIIKGSNHRWQAQIRWKKCWTTIHAFPDAPQELKQENTEILGSLGSQIAGYTGDPEFS